LSKRRRSDIAKLAAATRWKHRVDPRAVLMDIPRVAEVCRRHHIVELRAFGSVLRDDFRKESDVDLLYAADGWRMSDLLSAHKDFVNLLGRNVDLVSLRAVELSQNIYRKRSILDRSRVIYVA
jgi:uncharacterized protein